MKEKEKYFECIFTDGTREDFDNLCTSIEEYGANKDMITFKAKNYDTTYSVVLQIIPKSQIKQIINHYAENDIKKVFDWGKETTLSLANLEV